MGQGGQPAQGLQATCRPHNNAQLPCVGLGPAYTLGTTRPYIVYKPHAQRTQAAVRRAHPEPTRRPSITANMDSSPSGPAAKVHPPQAPPCARKHAQPHAHNMHVKLLGSGSRGECVAAQRLVAHPAPRGGSCPTKNHLTHTTRQDRGCNARTALDARNTNKQWRLFPMVGGGWGDP
jgi:hypothetical protein